MGVMKEFVGWDEKEIIELLEDNVLKYKLEDGVWVYVRILGTDPQIKFYFSVKEEVNIAERVRKPCSIWKMKWWSK